MVRIVLLATMPVLLVSCTGYFSNASIESHLEYRQSLPGSFVGVGDPPISQSQLVRVSAGYAVMEPYSNNVEAGVAQISRELNAKHGYCPNGYYIRRDPDKRTGDYGYYWFLECKA